MAALARTAVVLVVMAGCWGVWIAAGMLVDWASIDDVDLPARIVLEFGFLSACEVVLGIVRARLGTPHPGSRSTST